jgi:nicotinamidase/pyrazinamidase
MQRAAKTIFWEVDVQSDFMLPGGKLYVPGAEKIAGNIDLLVDVARQGRVFLISSGDAHNPDDPELRQWPPHCLRGTPGAALLPEAYATPRLVIPNENGFALPKDLGSYRQVTLEKNTLDVFDNPNTDALLARLDSADSPGAKPDTQFVVFGVATEYCVRCTVEGLLGRGRRVAIVTDAVRAIDGEEGEQIIESLQARGVKLLSTKEARALAEINSRGHGEAKAG